MIRVCIASTSALRSDVLGMGKGGWARGMGSHVSESIFGAARFAVQSARVVRKRRCDSAAQALIIS